MISGVFSAISQTSHQTPFPPRRISSAAVCVGARPGVQKGLGTPAAARHWCWGPTGCQEGPPCLQSPPGKAGACGSTPVCWGARLNLSLRKMRVIIPHNSWSMRA